MDRLAGVVPEEPQPPPIPPPFTAFSPSIVWMSPLQSFMELRHSWPSSLSLLRYLRVLLLSWLQLLSSPASARRCVLTTTLPVYNAPGPVGMTQRRRPYLSLRFSAMGLASSRMGLTSVWLLCFSSFFLKVFPLHFQLPDELSGDLGFFRLAPAEDDFLR